MNKSSASHRIQLVVAAVLGAVVWQIVAATMPLHAQPAAQSGGPVIVLSNDLVLGPDMLRDYLNVEMKKGYTIKAAWGNYLILTK